MSKDAIQFAREFLNSDFLRDELTSSPIGALELQKIGEALEKAASSPDTNSFDTLIAVAADALRSAHTLPPWLANFVAGVLTGEIQRPTKRGPDKYSKYDRDFRLWRCVDEVAKRFGYARYDNSGISKKKSGEPKEPTASEVVSEASGLSVEVVTTAYKKYQRKGQAEEAE